MVKRIIKKLNCKFGEIGKYNYLYKEDKFPFDPKNELELKTYIKKRWGPGYYSVMSISGPRYIEYHFRGEIK